MLHIALILLLANFIHQPVLFSAAESTRHSIAAEGLRKRTIGAAEPSRDDEDDDFFSHVAEQKRMITLRCLCPGKNKVTYFLPLNPCNKCGAQFAAAPADVTRILVHTIRTKDESDAVLEELEECIADRADINARYVTGVTPLVIAIFLRKPRIVSLLLKHGADYNSVDQRGASPLHYAIWGKQLDMLTMLLAQDRINHFVYDRSGYTPLDYAMSNELPVFCQLIFESILAREYSDFDLSPIIKKVLCYSISRQHKKLSDLIFESRAFDVTRIIKPDEIVHIVLDLPEGPFKEELIDVLVTRGIKIDTIPLARACCCSTASTAAKLACGAGRRYLPICIACTTGLLAGMTIASSLIKEKID